VLLLKKLKGVFLLLLTEVFECIRRGLHGELILPGFDEVQSLPGLEILEKRYLISFFAFCRPL
jgi:hypothetical protein